MKVFAASLLTLCMAAPLAAPTPVEANFITGKVLYEICTPQDTDPDAAVMMSECRGFIVGVFDGIEAASSVVTYSQNRQEDPVKLTCNTSGVTADQLIDIVVRYLEDRPEHRNKPASLLIVDAFSRAFPCPIEGT